MAVKVCEPSAAVLAMGQSWPMLEALLGGTGAMRSAGVSLMPKFGSEEQDDWKARLETAVLFPAYRRTVSVMVGKPFSSELVLTKETPAEIVAWAEDIDREGVNLHNFAAEMFEESFFGICGILVEAPKPPPIASPVPTKADQSAAGMRPYFVRVKHNQIVGWRAQLISGRWTLTQLRIKECVKEPDGAFGEVEVEQIRVLEPSRWAIYRKSSAALDAEWVVHESGDTPLDYIPFVPIYGRRAGFMVGHPPLIDLAYLNVRHWQSQSEQDTILHSVRCPILFFSGAPEGQTALAIGPHSVVFSPKENADLKWVAYEGEAIQEGAKSLVALEDLMVQAGAELLVKKPGVRTATESANDAEGNKSDLQRMVENLEDALNLALAYMSDFAKLPRTAGVQMFKDFGAAMLDQASATLVKDLAVGRIISNRTAITELKRRGELSAEVTPEGEAAQIEQEGPDLAELTNDPLGGPKPKPKPKTDPAKPEPENA